MKICFIDDSLGLTCKVIEAMKGYYKDQEDADLECEMILVNMEGENTDIETIQYYENIFADLKVKLEQCESIDDIKQKIDHLDAEKVMVDLCMDKKEDQELDKNEDYKCISMECKDALEKKNLSYFWYSGYLENEFKDKWQKSFQKLYNKRIPKIYERSELTQNYFKKAVAKEILGV